MNSTESFELLKLLWNKQIIVNGINFVYRMDLLVQDVKNKIRKETVGKPFLVHGTYLQDWLLYDTDHNWRIEPSICGHSR